MKNLSIKSCLLILLAVVILVGMGWFFFYAMGAPARTAMRDDLFAKKFAKTADELEKAVEDFHKTVEEFNKDYGPKISSDPNEPNSLQTL